jgi:hypothetical protein
MVDSHELSLFCSGTRKSQRGTVSDVKWIISESVEKMSGEQDVWISKCVS